MDETDLQLNNHPGHVIVEKGSKSFYCSIWRERRITITVITCCNAEDTFLPPACIMKGKNKKTRIRRWHAFKICCLHLKMHFLPRKSGTVASILDSHSSHCNSIEMLKFAQSEDILLMYLLSHTLSTTSRSCCF
ncbi:hypothetical protein P5V15_007080 [Pogonomyrmex californicus]